MTKRVVIIGGGLAGLAAAEALSARGLAVELLEARPRLGGRASSFDDKTTGTRIDNCQHVNLGCCTNFRHFCERTGLADAFRVERELTFVGPDGRLFRFAADRWPAPLHLATSFNRLGYLTGRDRRALAFGLRSLALADPADLEDITFSDWLGRHRQTENAVNRFWHVVLVSALSESLDRISAAYARKVFVDTFLAHREGWTVQIPAAPLEDLYGTTLLSHLRGQGAMVRTGAGVRRLVSENGRVVAAELRNGEVVTGDEFVLAVPHHLVGSLAPDEIADSEVVRAAAELETAPIASVHLWFDRPVTDLPHAVFVDRLSQWLFNRTALQASGGRQPSEDRRAMLDARGADAPRSGSHYYQVVISASRELEGVPSAEVIATVRDELAAIWPAAGEAELVHARLVTEHKAVFSVTPGAERLRPPQQSPVPNLQFAGDWTRTGWPATMEGAVRSGYLAAENVLSRCGTTERLVRPDLPPGRLARWLFRLPATAAK